MSIDDFINRLKSHAITMKDCLMFMAINNLTMQTCNDKHKDEMIIITYISHRGSDVSPTRFVVGQKDLERGFIDFPYMLAVNLIAYTIRNHICSEEGIS